VVSKGRGRPPVRVRFRRGVAQNDEPSADPRPCAGHPAGDPSGAAAPAAWAMFTAIVVNERPLAVSLGLGAICQGPRSTWCSEKSSDQNSALENVIDWLKSAIHISA
jgi:hypothetical protein